MKKSLKIALGLSAVVLVGAAVGASAGYMSLRSQIRKLPRDFTVTAHTGCHKTEDNSLESISRAIKAGADITEFDLRFDTSGKGVLSHDEGADNPVNLEEAFSLIALDGKIKVNIDVKSADNMKEVYLLSEKYGITDRVFYTGIEAEKVDTVKSETPQIPYYLNYSVDSAKKNDPEYISSLVSLVKEKGVAGLNIHFNQCSKRLVDTFRDQGLKVSLWTANNAFEMLVCLSMAPDNITTRYPETLINLLNSLNQ